MEVADKVNSLVVLQASGAKCRCVRSNIPRYLIQADIDEFPHIPIVMHQDHGVSLEACQRPIQLGSSVLKAPAAEKSFPNDTRAPFEAGDLRQ